MASKQSPKRHGIGGRAMHGFKRGEMASSSGRKVKKPRQAVAIALHEAGASRDGTPAGNRRNLARTKAEERQPEAGRKGGGGGEGRAAPYGQAAGKGIPGRSRMTKAQPARALGR